MSETETTWPPQVGDHIQIVATGAPGVVMSVTDNRHFVVAIYSPAIRTVTAAPRRTYGLRELGPASASPAVDTPAPTAPRRRARQTPPAE